MEAGKRKLLIITGIISAVVLIALFIVWYIVFALPKPQVTEEIADETQQTTESDIAQVEEPKYTSLIEGVPVEAEEERVLAVIIENYIDSRRQMTGLANASLVFEAEAEGGITRFLAIFPYQSLERVGPVRSARPYFVKWAEMFDAAIVHAGGSDVALSSIYSSASVFDLDCLALEGGLKNCFRDYLYYAPHNLFASLKDLREFIDEYKWNKPLSQSFFQYGPLSSLTIDSEENNASIIHVYYPFPEYFVRWDYDKENNRYLRFQAGAPHIDHGNNEQISVKNLVVMFTDYYPVDDAGRLSMKTDGEGQMFLFREGKAIAGTWSKIDNMSKLKFYGENGAELLFAPGKTWISIINNRDLVQWE